MWRGGEARARARRCWESGPRPFVAERAEGVERWLGAAVAAMGGAESEATDEAEAVRREAGALAGAL